MISVSLAEKIVLSHARSNTAEAICLSAAQGRILRETLICDRDQPAFNKSTMDGIAISSHALSEGIRSFVIKGIIPAGVRPSGRLVKPNECFKIMTGAVVPAGCDCVMPVEMIRIKNDQAMLTGSTDLKAGGNIRSKAQDCKKGTVLLDQGVRLEPNHIATAGSIGKSVIKVSRRPKVAIISTGDEIVDVSIKKIKPYQVRMSNAYAIEAAIAASGLGESLRFHLPDDPKIMEKELRKILSGFDVVVLSGGVSMGDFDHIPKVMKRLQVKMLFHKVSQKPGKPFWFGKSRGGQLIFALPGNPVSTQICAYRYVLPFLKKVAGLKEQIPFVLLQKDVELKSLLTNFLPVSIMTNDACQQLAMPVPTGGSGDFASISQTDGFIELDAGIKFHAKHSRVPFYNWGVYG